MPVAPFITVVMPVRNEARFIRSTLARLLEQDYPADRFEVIVADGMSDDGTREIVQELAQQHPNLLLRDNPGRRSSAGRNVGFRQGQGEYFLVVDGHCHIPSRNLLHDLAAVFEKSGADCLGRPQPLDPPDITPFQKDVAAARAARIGHGAGSLIYGDYEGFASPQSNGAAYRRQVFTRIGYVDEAFDACEDVEFNLRLEQAGMSCYTSPALTIRYYPRESLRALFRQMQRYGHGRFRLGQKHPQSLAFGTFIPPAFALAAALVPLSLLLLWAGVLAPLAWLHLGLIAAYVVLVAVQSLALARQGKGASFFRLMAIFPAIHLGLGFGFLQAAFSAAANRFHLRRGPVSRPERLKIAYVIDRIDGAMGGTERQLLALVAGLDRSRFDPAICCLRSSQWLKTDFSACPSLQLGFHSFKQLSSWARVLRFARHLRCQGFHIVQTHSIDGTRVGAIAAKLGGVPVLVSTRRGLPLWQSPGGFRVLRFMNRLADVFIANSAFMRAQTIRAESVDPGKIQVIPNALEDQGEEGGGSVDRNRVRESLGFTEEQFLFGIVATLRPVKRHEDFVQAAALVSRQDASARFVVVGDGERRPELELLAASLGLGDRLVFLGARTDVPRILAALDAGILCSAFESSPNALMEYIAHGLPVVATAVGGSLELVKDGNHGLLVPPCDPEALASAMMRVRRGELLIQNLEAAARELKKRCNPDRVVAAYQDLYHAVFLEKRSQLRGSVQ